MGHLWVQLQLLGAAAVTFMLGGFTGASSHSLHYLFTVVSEPSPGLPRFLVSSHFDGQLCAYYDSEGRIGVPRADWMEEMVKVDAQYWDWLNRNARNAEQILKWQLGMVMGHYNHSTGLHTMQWIFGCTLSEDGLKGGSHKFGYDGKEALRFDKESLTWTANDAVAEDYKRKWESEPGRTQRSKFYLEEKCISMLLRHLEVREKVVRRRVAPEVKVTHKAGVGGLETLICHLRGFYPMEIDATWRKDGEVLEQETLRGNIVPNSDGTYNTWLSIEIDKKDRDKHQCHVEHDSLAEFPGSAPDLALEQPSYGILVGSVLGLILSVTFATLVTVAIRRRGRQTPPATNAEMQEMNPPRRRRHICILDAN